MPRPLKVLHTADVHLDPYIRSKDDYWEERRSLVRQAYSAVIDLGLREPVWRGQQLVPRGVTLRVPPVAGRAPAAQVLASLPQERQREVSGRTYIVKRGDTLSRIATRHGVSTQALASANGIRKPSQLHVGRRLRIPGSVERDAAAVALSEAELARAVFAAMGRPERLEFIDMPEPLRARYQYYTQASLDRLRAAGCPIQPTPLEEGVRRYVQDHLDAADPYR